MKIPTTLKHKPVITVENYEEVDGRAAYQSDAKGLSLGLAQWNDRGRCGHLRQGVALHGRESGRASRRSCRCTACSTSPS